MQQLHTIHQYSIKPIALNQRNIPYVFKQINGGNWDVMLTDKWGLAWEPQLPQTPVLEKCQWNWRDQFVCQATKWVCKMVVHFHSASAFQWWFRVVAGGT